MFNLKVVFASLIFVLGISGNNLWNYDMSNIIGDQEPIHISVDSNLNDVSGSEFNMSDDFDELDDAHTNSALGDFWSAFVSSFKRIVNYLREGTVTTEYYHRALQRFHTDLDNMSSNDSIGGINFNPFIGMIRWITGDLVFYELYCIFMVGVSLIWIKVGMIAIQLFRIALDAFCKVFPSLRNTMIIQWLLKKYI